MKKMYSTVCDECRVCTPSVKDGPDGWLHLQANGPGPLSIAEHYDFCSWQCLLRFTKATTYLKRG